MTVEVSTWSPEDFLIHGEFCPTQEIELAVERCRRRVQATAALLLVADDWVVMRTLCACTPADHPEVERLRSLLSTASLLPKRRGRKKRKRSSGLQDHIRGPRPGILRKRFPATADKVLAELVEIARDNEDEELAEFLSKGSPPWVPARLPDRVHGARMHCALLFYEPRSEIAEQEGSSLVVVDSDVIDISARVNSTAHAVGRRDDFIMKRLDQKMDPAEYVAGTVDFRAAAQSLVELAVEVSGADAGACYLVDHSKKVFELKATRVVGENDRFWSYPEEIATDAEELAATATHQHRTLQLPPGFGRLPVRPTLEAIGEGGGGPSTELASPLPGPLATPKAPAVGVLTVAKLVDPKPYGAYEIAVMRNVALRLALIATTTNTTQAAEMFARMSMRAGRLPWSSKGSKRRRSTPHGVVLPDDIHEALPAIEDALSTLGAVTHSGSATFRAALPTDDSASSHGLTLARVAGYPATSGRSKKHAFQPEAEWGYNWCVLRSGEISNVPVVDRKDPNYSQHRRNTESELAVPVYVEGRAVGVVNLESPVKHAFDAHVEIAQAAAEHIGLAIANARLALSAVVQERATDVLREAHEITHMPEKFDEKLSQIPPRAAEEIRTVAADIQDNVDRLRVAAPDGQLLLPRDGDTTFPALVRHKLDAMEMRYTGLVQAEHFWFPHEVNVAVTVVKALGDILDNARRHRPEGAPSPHLSLSHDFWGGQRQDVLTIRTTPSHVHMAEQRINIYRCPMRRFGFREKGESKREAQMGAYLAGLQIRRVGGEVHLRYEKEAVAVVIVSVPSPPVSAGFRKESAR